MNFKQNNNGQNMDEFNIKHHLNTSLDQKGISVSEDLINRTLEAINKQGKTKQEEDHRPLITKIRLLMKVAAAVLVFMVGLSAIHLFNPSGLKQKSVNEEAKSFTLDGKNDIAISDRAGELDNEIATKEAQEIDDQVNDTLGSWDNGTVEEDNKKELGTNELTSLSNYELSFTDITAIKEEEVKSITVKSHDKDIRVQLKEPVDIEKFYSVMENYRFKYDEADDSTVEYTIKLVGKDNESHIIIGLYTITVDNTHRDVASHSKYSVLDTSLLIDDLKEFLASYDN